jgi:hypothetical protein
VVNVIVNSWVINLTSEPFWEHLAYPINCRPNNHLQNDLSRFNLPVQIVSGRS